LLNRGSRCRKASALERIVAVIIIVAAFDFQIVGLAAIDRQPRRRRPDVALGGRVQLARRAVTEFDYIFGSSRACCTRLRVVG
jgi:hypothetical protein